MLGEICDETAKDFTKLMDMNLNEKLKPINESIDEMLIRLEEFQTMVAVVQQERCNSIGLTGELSQSFDHRHNLKELFVRIDAVEKLVDHVKATVNMLENKLDIAEKQHGIVDNTTRLKSFLSPFFRKSTDVNVDGQSEEIEVFSTEKYFN